MTAIEQLAVELLDEREWLLVKRLALILDDDAYDAGSLIVEIQGRHYCLALVWNPGNLPRGVSGLEELRSIATRRCQVVAIQVAIS
jgi:hypothetical protein